MDRLEKTQLVVEAALDRKAEEIVALDVREISSFADVFVIATGRSDRQVQAIADAISQAAKAAGEAPLGVEGHREGRWVLIDLSDVVVHVVQPEIREHYEIERLWSDAPRIELPGGAQAAAGERSAQ